MHQSVNVYQFRDAFRHCGRGDQFSYEALGILFDHLEEYEEASGTPMELDVVALCCEFYEMGWQEVADNYSVDLEGCEDDDERADAVREYLEDNTVVCGEYEDSQNGTTFVFQVF